MNEKALKGGQGPNPYYQFHPKLMDDLKQAFLSAVIVSESAEFSEPDKYDYLCIQFSRFVATSFEMDEQNVEKNVVAMIYAGDDEISQQSNIELEEHCVKVELGFRWFATSKETKSVVITGFALKIVTSSNKLTLRDIVLDRIFFELEKTGFIIEPIEYKNRMLSILFKQSVASIPKMLAKRAIPFLPLPPISSSILDTAESYIMECISSVSAFYLREGELSMNPAYENSKDIKNLLKINQKKIWTLRSDLILAVGNKNSNWTRFKDTELADAIDFASHDYVNWECRYGHPTLAVPYPGYDGSVFYGGYLAQRDGFIEVYTFTGRYHRDDLDDKDRTILEAYSAYHLQNAYGNQCIVFIDALGVDNFVLSIFMHNDPLPDYCAKRSYDRKTIQFILESVHRSPVVPSTHILRMNFLIELTDDGLRNLLYEFSVYLHPRIVKLLQWNVIHKQLLITLDPRVYSEFIDRVILDFSPLVEIKFDEKIIIDVPNKNLESLVMLLNTYKDQRVEKQGRQIARKIKETSSVFDLALIDEKKGLKPGVRLGDIYVKRLIFDGDKSKKDIIEFYIYVILRNILGTKSPEVNVLVDKENAVWMTSQSLSMEYEKEGIRKEKKFQELRSLPSYQFTFLRRTPVIDKSIIDLKSVAKVLLLSILLSLGDLHIENAGVVNSKNKLKLAIVDFSVVFEDTIFDLSEVSSWATLLSVLSRQFDILNIGYGIMVPALPQLVDSLVNDITQFTAAVDAIWAPNTELRGKAKTVLDSKTKFFKFRSQTFIEACRQSYVETMGLFLQAGFERSNISYFDLVISQYIEEVNTRFLYLDKIVQKLKLQSTMSSHYSLTAK